MTLLYRYGRDGRTRFARTGRLIADTPEGVTLWIAPGSPQIESVLADGRPLRFRPDPVRPPLTVPSTWDDPHLA